MGTSKGLQHHRLPASGTRVQAGPQAGRHVSHVLHSVMFGSRLALFSMDNPEVSEAGSTFTNLKAEERNSFSQVSQSLILPVLIHSSPSNWNWPSTGWVSISPQARGWALGTWAPNHLAADPLLSLPLRTQRLSLFGLPSLEGHTTLAGRNQRGIPSPALLEVSDGTCPLPRPTKPIFREFSLEDSSSSL